MQLQNAAHHVLYPRRFETVTFMVHKPILSGHTCDSSNCTVAALPFQLKKTLT